MNLRGCLTIKQILVRMHTPVPEESTQRESNTQKGHRGQNGRLGRNHGTARIAHLATRHIIVTVRVDLGVVRVQAVGGGGGGARRVRGQNQRALLAAARRRTRDHVVHLVRRQTKTPSETLIERTMLEQINGDGSDETRAAEHVTERVHVVPDRAVVRLVRVAVGVRTVDHAVEAVQKVAKLKHANADLTPGKRIADQEANADNAQGAVREADHVRADEREQRREAE